MSTLSIFHALSGLIALVIGAFLFGRRKGNRSHRLLGWIYVVTMFLSLAGILVRTRNHPAPFAGYAVFTLLLLIGALLASRGRSHLPAWRGWHGALMSLTMIGSIMAAGSIMGGALFGASEGPAFYRLFNAVILCVTTVGLWLVNSRKVLWGQNPRPVESRARAQFTMIAVASSLLLVASQWALAWPA